MNKYEIKKDEEIMFETEKITAMDVLMPLRAI